MDDKKGITDIICSGPLSCFLFIFISTYLIWWLVLDGPARWDKKFHREFQDKKLPILIKDPLGLEKEK